MSLFIIVSIISIIYSLFFMNKAEAKFKAKYNEDFVQFLYGFTSVISTLFIGGVAEGLPELGKWWILVVPSVIYWFVKTLSNIKRYGFGNAIRIYIVNTGIGFAFSFMVVAIACLLGGRKGGS